MADARVLTPAADTGRSIASLLLRNGCYTTNPHLESTPHFTWGRLLGPARATCSCRVLNGFPLAARTVAEELASSARAWIGEVDLVIGMESAGVPWATRVATLFSAPLVSVSAEGKSGRINLGRFPLRKGFRTILIDDSVVFGDTAVRALDLLYKEEGITVDAVLSITNWKTRRMSEAFGSRGVTIGALVDSNSLLSAAVIEKLIDAHQRRELKEFYVGLDDRYTGGVVDPVPGGDED